MVGVACDTGFRGVGGSRNGSFFVSLGSMVHHDGTLKKYFCRGSWPPAGLFGVTVSMLCVF